MLYICLLRDIQHSTCALAYCVCLGRSVYCLSNYLLSHSIPTFVIFIASFSYIPLFWLVTLHLWIRYEMMIKKDYTNALRIHRFAPQWKKLNLVLSLCILSLFLTLAVSSAQIRPIATWLGTAFISISFFLFSIVSIVLGSCQKQDQVIPIFKGHYLKIHKERTASWLLACCMLCSALINALSYFLPEAFFAAFPYWQSCYFLSEILLLLVLSRLCLPAVLQPVCHVAPAA